VEDEINQKHTLWSDELAEEMLHRSQEIESGKLKTNSWQEIKQKAENILKNR
jgi:hypothetical protein